MMMFISATSKIVKDYCDEQSPIQTVAFRTLDIKRTYHWGWVDAKNTHIRGKDHYMTDLLYDWFGFKQTSKTVLIR